MKFPEDFRNKKILVYGLGKTGVSVCNFLEKKKIKFSIWDDKEKFKNKNKDKKFYNKNFDYIILSPGIDIYHHRYKKFFLSHKKKIITDLDIFFALKKKYKFVIGVTGTNGKSSFCSVLQKILKKNKIKSKILANFGKPVLSERISSNEYCILELSSYQLDYSKKLKLDRAIILNLSADHLERHETLSKYKLIKLKIFSFLNKTGLGFVNYQVINNKTIEDKRIRKFKSINKKLINFLFSKNLNITLKDFEKNNLPHRNEVFLNKKNFQFINDSKSTNFDATRYAIKKYNNIILILGGELKRKDEFKIYDLKNKIFKIYVFGKKIKKLTDSLKKQSFTFLKYKTLKEILYKSVSSDYSENIMNPKKFVVLFSPGAASFDQYKNFEQRGLDYKKIVNAIFKR